MFKSKRCYFVVRSLKPVIYSNLRSKMTFTTCKTSPEAKYKIRIAMPFEYDNVTRFMIYNYLMSEPSLLSINNGYPSYPSPILVYLMHENIREGKTLITLDHYNCVVGAAINVDSRPSDPDRLMEIARCVEDQNTKDYLEFTAFCSKQSDLWNAYCQSHIFEIAHVAVNPEHQGKGLARKLIEESYILGRDLGYQALRIDCTSFFTQKAVEKFGWNCILAMAYRRYFNNGEFIFKKVTDPHVSIKIYGTELTDYSHYSPPIRNKN